MSHGLSVHWSDRPYSFEFLVVVVLVRVNGGIWYVIMIREQGAHRD
jgi:hypothetical protein